MPYTPFTWHDGPGGGTPIVASRLNAIEQGIADAHDNVDPLVPYQQAIISGAIVDHNLDVTDPPNGYYVRWESGWQECVWSPGGVVYFDDLPSATWTLQNITFRRFSLSQWTFPATFLQSPWVDCSIDGVEDGAVWLPRLYIPQPYITTDTYANSALVMLDDPALEYLYGLKFFAAGRWK